MAKNNAIEADFIEAEKSPQPAGLADQNQINVIDLKNLLLIVNKGSYNGEEVDYIAVLKQKLVANINLIEEQMKSK